MGHELYLGGVLSDGEVASPYHLETDRLRTHGVVVGMTGSGKTGLCLVLLEELARAGVPVIAIDPKGDLGNLGLLFPELRGEDFAPWVEGDDPAAIADRWRKGLGEWGLQPEQLAALKSQLALSVYTPGSEAGQPIDVLGSFRRPADGADEDARRTVVAACVSGLLGLVGRKSDPIRDPAHIVLSQILDAAWTAGTDPTLEEIILQLVDPPFAKVGVFPLDRFFPPDDRMDLAMTLNGILAAPSFAAWTEGAPLDVAQMLAPPAEAGGRTRVSVITLAHLAEGQRSFFLSLLLGQLQAWSRSQPGTDGLRALLFFDEAAGYLPPHPANPPTKAPLLTMMKQARAVGLGVVLATQNPVDLDYKALSNAGVWAIGRLQTPQDRDRLLKGLGRPELHDVVEALDKRQFLIHDAAEDQPSVIQSRWAMCYLRGPFTSAEIARLPRDETFATPPLAAPAPRPAAPVPFAAPVAAPAPSVDDGLLPAPPPVPGDTWFLDPRVAFSERLAGAFDPWVEAARPDGKIAWRPALYADLDLRFDEDKAGFFLDHRERRVWFPVQEGAPGESRPAAVEPGDLLARPDQPGRYHALPAWMDEAKELKALQRQVTDDVYRSETRGMFVHKKLKCYGKPGEAREDFERRCRQLIEARIDAGMVKLQKKVTRDADRLEQRIRIREDKLVEQEGVIQSRKAEEMVNIGETVFSLFSGRKRSITSVMSRRRQTRTARDRLDRTRREIDDLEGQIDDLKTQLGDDVAALRREEEAQLVQVEDKEVRLEKNDVRLKSFGVLWVPVTRRI
jgi:hypothetical protein